MSVEAEIEPEAEEKARLLSKPTSEGVWRFRLVKVDPVSRF